MNDYRNDEIIYDEGWQTVSEPQYRTPYINNIENNNTDVFNGEQFNPETDQPPENTKADKTSKQLLITVQLIVCIAVAIIMCCIKLLGGKLYKDVHLWFENEMQNSVIITNTDHEIDLNKFLGSTDDEVSNTQH